MADIKDINQKHDSQYNILIKKFYERRFQSNEWIWSLASHIPKYHDSEKELDDIIKKIKQLGYNIRRWHEGIVVLHEITYYNGVQMIRVSSIGEVNSKYLLVREFICRLNEMPYEK